MHYKALAAVIGVVALTVGAGSAAASGGSHGHWKKVRIEFVPTGAVTTQLGQVCDPADPADPPVQCEYLSTTTNVTQTGDLMGSTVEGEVSAAGAPGLFTQSVAGTFTGTVNGCGDGGFRYVGNVVFGGPTGDFSYRIVDGSGFGDLAGITGSYGSHGADTSLHGTVRCLQSR